MKVDDLKGKPVVSLADGARVGTVKDLVVDSQQLTLTDLVLGGDQGEGLLRYDRIHSNGNDAITIENIGEVQWNTGKIDRRLMSDFLQLAVVDDSGRALGHVHDVDIGPAGGISSISVREGGIFGIGAHETVVPRAAVHAVGPKLITVQAPTEP